MMTTLEDLTEREASCVSILVLPDELQPIVEVLDSRVAVLLANEVLQWPLENHHVVKIKLVLAVYFDSAEEPILHQADKSIETVELHLKL